MAKHGTKSRTLAAHEKANYGGAVKPTTPGIKKMSGSQPMTQFQKDNAREDKQHQHASKPWKSKGKAATSKGSCDVPGDKPSQRVGRGPGYDDSKGYAKR